MLYGYGTHTAVSARTQEPLDSFRRGSGSSYFDVRSIALSTNGRFMYEVLNRFSLSRGFSQDGAEVLGFSVCARSTLALFNHPQRLPVCPSLNTRPRTE